jgi:mannose-6-phosphate isomerase-like protein (cupin superfamily)
MKLLNITEAEVVKRKYGIMTLIAGVRSTVIKSKNLDVKILEIEPNLATSKHYHEKSESVYYLLEGELTAEINDEIFEMKKGDIMLVDINESHRFLNNTSEKSIVLEAMAPAYAKDDIFYVE